MIQKEMNERRFLTPEITEMRADPETGKISGYAMIFNKRSVLLFGQFYERILPEAMNDVIENSDCLALLDHERSRGILGRSKYGKGTLSMKVDERGLFTEFTPPKTALAEEVVEYLKRGEIDSMSFEFSLAKDGDIWEERSDGMLDRTITKFKSVTDVSLVYRAAYPQTTAQIRSLEEYRKTTAPDPRPSLDELNKYYQEQESKLNKFKK